MDFAEEIKSRVKMPEILRLYGIEIRRGSRIRCPLHNGNDFNCSVKNDYIHCFVCGQSADQFAFVQKYFGITFREAVEKLNSDFALGLPLGCKIDKRTQEELARKAYERKREQQEKIEKLEALQDAVLDAHSAFCKAFRDLQDYKPSRGDDALKQQFVQALGDIEYARYLLDITRGELYEYEKRTD